MADKQRRTYGTAVRMAAVAILAVALVQCGHTPPVDPTPAAAPSVPSIPLVLTTIIPAEPPGKSRAYLHDKGGTKFEGVEGDIIDGRYKLLRVGTDSVVVTYLDGTGQKVIYRGG